MAAVIRIEVQGSGGGVQEVKQDIQDLGRAADDTGGRFSALKEIGIGALRSIGEMGVGLALNAIGTVTGAISEGIEDAKGYAIIAAQTEAVIKSTGAAAGVSAEHVAEYAGALSDAAGASLFGDDQIQQATNMLLTFTNIKGATLDASTAIAVDMAQALGGAPVDNAIQLGKALNDPIKGVTALTRVGVTFTDEQKAMIQAMQEAGDTAGAQQVILDELNKEFGGSAQAAADATGGWSEFNGRLGEAKETMGAAVLPLLNMLVGVLASDVMPIVEAAAGAFAEIVGVLADAGPMSSEFAETMGYLASQLGLPGDFIQDIVLAVQDMIPVIQSLIPVFVDDLSAGLQTTSGVFLQLQSTIDTVMQGIMAVVNAVLPQILAFWQAHGADIMATIQDAWTRIMAIIQTALQLIQSIVGPALQFIANFISSHGAEIQALLSNTWTAIKAAIDIALTLIQGVLKAALQIIQGDWSGAWTTIKEMCARIVQDLWTIIQAGLNNVVTLFGGLVTQVMDVLDKLPGQAAELGGNIIDGIIEGVSNAAGALYSMLSDIASNALDAAKDALGISSPSAVFADEVGQPIITGLILGVQSMIPNLVGVLDDVALAIISKAKKVTEKVVDEANKIQDALIEQAQGIADKLGNVMADSLTGSASLDRAKAKAIAGLTDIAKAQQQVATNQIEEIKKLQKQQEDAESDTVKRQLGAQIAAKQQALATLQAFFVKNQEETQKQLATAAAAASGFGDPKQAAAFFKLRSDQIFELAKLRDQIEASTDEKAKQRLIEQYNLIGLAQKAELQAFDTKAGGNSPLETITQKIQELLASPNLPGILDDKTGVIGALMQALPQLIAMSGGGNPSASSTTNSNQFTYAPTITTTGPVGGPVDQGTARALSGV